MRTHSKPYTAAWIACIATCIICFVFFQWLYPYHLHHREQITLFDSRAFDILQFGGAGDCIDGYLTQFFYYRVAGPLIISAVLALVWLGFWLLTQRIAKRSWISIIVATAVTLWQALCQTAHNSTLQMPIALAFITLSVGALWKHRAIAMVTTVIVVYLVGNPFRGRLWAWPDFSVEHRMALDSEAYFGNWDRVLQLARPDSKSQTEVFYHNLANAVNGLLADSLLCYKQIGTQGMFPTLGTESNYMIINALGELWYRIGALTDAEHCTMLGMIFSPHSTGTRYVKRLAMINLANGDNEAAMKYLRMLLPSQVHGQWARDRLPGCQTETVKAEIAAFAPKLATTDTLHLANDMVMTLRNMHQSHSNPMAYEYLMCLHLLNKNLEGFLDDYDPMMPKHKIFDEALVLALRMKGATPETAMTYSIGRNTLLKFRDYLSLVGTDHKALDDFSDTYWYYYDFL